MRKIKQSIICFIILFLGLSSLPPTTYAAGVSAHSAILIEQKSGRVLYEKNADAISRIASITKIMTAILAIESGKIDQTTTVFEIEELHGKWEALKRDIASHQQMEQSLSANIGEREQEINCLRVYIQRADEEIDALHKHLLFVSEEVEKLEGKKEVLKERKKNASQNKEQLERLVKEYTQTKKELLIAKQKEENDLTNFENDVAKTREEVAEQERLFATYSENLDEQLEQLKSEYFELANAQTASRNEIAFLEQQKHQTSEKEARLLKANEQYVQQRVDLERKKGALIDKLQNFQQELQDATRQLKEKLLASRF